ncbi:MAG: hypothetical protein HKP10_04920 [Kiritimatiellales bacterium]|nr:hypothetical protein [Pontiella sp.]NNJ70614.1 hypothetical protein [Kiritimatiellales bacterium]
MGLFNLLKPARKVLVVDAVSLNESLGMKGNVPPRSQLQTLRRLSRFSQREKLTVVAVLTGKPLNKAPAGKKFEGVLVVYSKSPEQHAKYLTKTAGSKGGILVTGNAAAEKMMGGSANKMRVSTFRKTFDTGNDSDGQERSEGGRKRGNRPPRRRNQKQSSSGGNGGNEPKRERPPKERSESDAINELIDLVD